MLTQTRICTGTITFHGRGHEGVGVGSGVNVCLPYVQIQKFVCIIILGNSASHLIEMTISL